MKTICRIKISRRAQEKYGSPSIEPRDPHLPAYRMYARKVLSTVIHLYEEVTV